MTIELLPLPLPATADASKFVDFGREVRGVDPGNLTSEEFAAIHEALYKVCLVFQLAVIDILIYSPRQHSALLFRDVSLTPEQQYALTKVCTLHVKLA